MKYLFRGLLLIILGVVAVGLFVRFAPVTPEDWHIDPMTVERPDAENFYLLRPEDGDGPAPVFDAPPETLASAFQALAGAMPRSSLIQGSAAEGHMTVMVRSQLMGFPDFVTVKVMAVEGGSTLAVFSRSKYGYSDLGVNKARVENWLAELEVRLQP